MTKLTPIALAIRTYFYDLIVAGHREARFARARELHDRARSKQFVEKFASTAPAQEPPTDKTS